MSKAKKLSIETLINKKQMLAEKKEETREVYIPALGGTVVIKRPTKEIAIEAMEKGGAEGDVYLVYNTIVEPDLSSQELLDAYGCSDYPISIVDELFDFGITNNLAVIALEMLGVNSKVEMIGELKK